MNVVQDRFPSLSSGKAGGEGRELGLKEGLNVESHSGHDSFFDVLQEQLACASISSLGGETLSGALISPCGIGLAEWVLWKQ